MVLITRKDIEALQNGDLCFVENPKTGELLSALYYDSDGSRDIGTGHVVRCMCLAEELKGHALKPVFCTK